MPLQPARTVDAIQSMGLVSDALVDGPCLKHLTGTHDFSHECVRIAVGRSASVQYVKQVRERAVRFRRHPLAIHTDKAAEFINWTFMAWPQSHRIRHIPMGVQPSMFHAIFPGLGTLGKRHGHLESRCLRLTVSGHIPDRRTGMSATFARIHGQSLPQRLGAPCHIRHDSLSVRKYLQASARFSACIHFYP